MLNLLTSDQNRQADNYTIKYKPIRSIDLMEKASAAFVDAFTKHYPHKEKQIAVYCGTGNNGGDGLAVARILHRQGYKVSVKIARLSGKSTTDFDANLTRLMSQGIVLDEFEKISDIKEEKADILIDALLGSGLNKPLCDGWLTLVEWLNSLGKTIVSIDIPTGFKSEGTVSRHDVTIKADLAITFQRPKINFLLPDSALCIKHFEVVDIGLEEEFIQALETPFKLIADTDIKALLKARPPFSHKGTFGHALLVAGSTETMGAALLVTEACVYSGAGLTSTCIPPEGLTSLNIRVPEAMAVIRVKGVLPKFFNFKKYSAIGLGPGLGTSEQSIALIHDVVSSYHRPIVIDADGLNILASEDISLANLAEGSILTPHVKEFDRLFGEHDNWWERLETAKKKAQELKLVIVLKNRFTMIFTRDGKCIFNPTGTPAMATGGMGDVLTGIITSFLSQGYKSEAAAILGVFLHGKAGEEHVQENGSYVVPASRLAARLPETIGKFT